MIKLSREIRFALTSDYQDSITNSWCGWPSSNRIVPRLTLKCVVSGQPDSQTGYICNVKVLDDLLRGIVTKHLIPNFADQTAESMLLTIDRLVKEDWQSVSKIEEVSLHLSPFLSYKISAEHESMVCLTQQFEFSAAHRLHCDDFSEEENQKLFGKCNNPEGHGHNYVVEVTVAAAQDEMTNQQVIALHEFESIVKREIIDRLDHKHLNRDVDYFADINPSVENIVVAVWKWLDGKFGDVKLKKVKVFETPKTWAEFSN